jgi:hypothetical protein
MTTLPPMLSSDQQLKDAEHLKLLSIFYFVLAGFGAVGLVFLGGHYAFMRAMFANPEMWKAQKGGPPPEFFMDIMIWFYGFALAVIVVSTVLNILSGIFIRQRRNRMFSLIVGGLNCLHVPLGTLLGVFTIVTLTRESVRRLYETSRG